MTKVKETQLIGKRIFEPLQAIFATKKSSILLCFAKDYMVFRNSLMNQKFVVYNPFLAQYAYYVTFYILLENLQTFFVLEF